MARNGSPHPTKSKPCKIGRKHTDAPSERVKQKRKNTAMRRQQLGQARWKKYKHEMRRYHLGYRAFAPPKPGEPLKTPPHYPRACENE